MLRCAMKLPVLVLMDPHLIHANPTMHEDAPGGEPSVSIVNCTMHNFKILHLLITALLAPLANDWSYKVQWLHKHHCCDLLAAPALGVQQENLCELDVCPFSI